MEFVETPQSRFANLPDFPWEPRWVDVDPVGLRMAYVEAGPADGPVALLLHGEPSWSYLYRFMIRDLAAGGMRVIAPDLIGFGRSSKPTQKRDYTYARHVTWTTRLVEALDLRGVTLFAQDWGSLIGLRLAAELGDRFARVAIGNGFLPTGDLPSGGGKALANAGAFLAWRTFSQLTPVFPVARILQAGTARHLDREELGAYTSPFPSRKHLAGARVFPKLVPLTPLDPARRANLAAWRVLERWDKPFLTLFSSGDPITRGLDGVLQKRIPGAQGQPHTRVRGGHFLQEDSGPELARRLLDW